MAIGPADRDVSRLIDSDAKPAAAKPAAAAPRRLNPARLLLPAAVLLTCLPILSAGFPAGHDWPFELARIAAFRHALTDGQLPPFWADSLYGGFGSPIFLFYAPAFSALAAGLSWPLGSVPAGAAAALALCSLTGALAMSRAVRAALGPEEPAAVMAGRIAGAVFVLSPYLLGDALLRNASAEYAALCLAPIALWGVFEIARRPRRGALILAAGMALTILAHNLTALVVAGMVCWLGAVLYWPPRHRGALPAIGGFLLGLLLAAFFWVPALALSDRVQLHTITGGRFQMAENFPDPAQIFGYGAFFSGGLLVPLAILLAAGLALRPRAEAMPARRPALALLALAAGFLLLQTSAGAPLYRTLPFLELFQFPWRFNGPLALAAALLSGLLAAAWLGRSRRPERMMIGVALLAAANGLPHLTMTAGLSDTALRRDLGDLSAAALIAQGRRATVLDEYLPAGADPELWRQANAGEAVLAADPGITILEERRAGSTRVIRVRADHPGRVLLTAWDFPVWSVEADQGSVRADSGPGGVIAVAVARGEAAFTLTRDPPAIRRAGLIVSLAAALIWMGLWIGPRPRRR